MASIQFISHILFAVVGTERMFFISIHFYYNLRIVCKIRTHSSHPKIILEILKAIL